MSLDSKTARAKAEIDRLCDIESLFARFHDQAVDAGHQDLADEMSDRALEISDQITDLIDQIADTLSIPSDEVISSIL